MFNNSDSPDYKWRPRLGYYCNASKNAKLFPQGHAKPGKTAKIDLKKIQATSYDWWVFVKNLKGKVVFNDYYYSSPTRYHQVGTKALLKKLGVKVDVHVSTRYSLSDLNPHVEDLFRSICQHEAKIARPRTQERTRVSLRDSIEHCKAEIKLFRSLGAKLSPETRDKIRAEVNAVENSREATQRNEEALKAERAKRAEIKDILDNSFVNV